MSAVIAVLILFLVMICPWEELFVIAAFCVCVIGIYEMNLCVKKEGCKTLPVVGYFWSLVIPAMGFSKLHGVVINPGYYLLAVFVSMVILAIYMITVYPEFKISDLAVTVFGPLYVVFTFSCIVMLRLVDSGDKIIWLLFIGCCMTDIFAYFVGSAFGKTHFLKKVSPHKSLEGSIGGIVGTTVVVTLFSMFWLGDVGIDNVYVVLIGILCSIFSQLGDWFMSAFKRLTGIKDFGKIMPGHGGVLDRFDSILFAAPMVLGILMIVQ